MNLPCGNFILDALANVPRGEEVFRDARIVRLEQSHITTQRDTVMASVDFPTSALLSIIGLLGDGSSCEVAAVGSEGFVEVDAALRTTVAKRTAICSIKGEVVRIPIEAFQRGLTTIPESANVVFRSVRARVFVSEQTLVCNTKHAVTQRVARWLLLSSVRIGRSELSVTHEYLASVIGIRRPSVTTAAAQLARANAIVSARGSFLIKDRRALEALSCECYGLCEAALRDVTM